jgi:hypothetical protein
VPFAPPNLLISLESLGSNPTFWPVVGRSGRGRGQEAWTMIETKAVTDVPHCGRADPAVSFLCPSQLDTVRFRQLFQRFRKPSMRVF